MDWNSRENRKGGVGGRKGARACNRSAMTDEQRCFFCCAADSEIDQTQISNPARYPHWNEPLLAITSHCCGFAGAFYCCAPPSKGVMMLHYHHHHHGHGQHRRVAGCGTRRRPLHACMPEVIRHDLAPRSSSRPHTCPRAIQPMPLLRCRSCGRRCCQLAVVADLTSSLRTLLLFWSLCLQHEPWQMVGPWPWPCPWLESSSAPPLAAICSCNWRFSG